jgi:hypothetical protein
MKLIDRQPVGGTYPVVYIEDPLWRSGPKLRMDSGRVSRNFWERTHRERGPKEPMIEFDP